MTIAWVLGSGGLLGTALCAALARQGTDLFLPAERFCWGSDSELSVQLVGNVQAFASRVCAAGRWEIYWAAGVGTMGSSEAALEPETQALALLLRLLEADPRLTARSGGVAFASSAGAIYAGSTHDIVTENTSPTPTTAYAREKLRQEELLRSFAVASHRATVLVARISTLYGPGQAAGKPQGLLTHIARCIVRNKPIQIYVPFDTIRDYISADAAATAMVFLLRSMCEEQRILTKIVASEQPTTIAEIISVFRRLARRAPRIVTSASRLSKTYPRRVQFKSITLPNCPSATRSSLFIGISHLMIAERAGFVRATVKKVRNDVG